MSVKALIFRVHALKRMFQRRISEEEVKQVLETGEVIEEYPNDTPYPSRLISGTTGNRWLHIVAASNTLEGEDIVITVYEPDVSIWEPDFKKRK